MMMGLSRNASCWCGSGKKFKHCHGTLERPIENTTPPPPFVNAAVTKARSKVFTPAGRCVYCGDREPPLTREHIIPQGLGGGLIMHKASCGACQKITRDLETYCLRGLLLPHRLNIGLVQHPDELGDTLPLRFKIDDREEVRRVPLEDFPNYLALPQIHRAPGMVCGGTPGEFFRVSFIVWGIEEELRALHESGNAMLVDNFDMNKFARMLAKIAHSLAAAEIGVEHFDPALPDFILGRAPDLASYLVGAWTEPYGAAPPAMPLHQVGLGMQQWGRRWLASVRIKLFANQPNAPTYRVIVGELIDSPELLERFGLWSL
jgi:hypothetical protein